MRVMILILGILICSCEKNNTEIISTQSAETDSLRQEILLLEEQNLVLNKNYLNFIKSQNEFKTEFNNFVELIVTKNSYLQKENKKLNASVENIKKENNILKTNIALIMKRLDRVDKAQPKKQIFESEYSKGTLIIL